MPNCQLDRRPIPLWQIAPLMLIPAALVAAVYLDGDLALTPFVTTFASTCTTLLVLSMHRPERQLATRQVDPVLPRRRQD
jgi:hypothetical protein